MVDAFISQLQGKSRKRQGRSGPALTNPGDDVSEMSIVGDVRVESNASEEKLRVVGNSERLLKAEVAEVEVRHLSEAGRGKLAELAPEVAEVRPRKA